MQDKPSKAKRYRHYAEEARLIAQGIFDHEERQTHMKIASELEQLACKVEAK